MIDRELDAKIAAQVFQLPNIRTDPDKLGYEPGGLVYGQHPFFNAGVGIPVPHYSTDIRDAWLLVEKLSLTVYAPHALFADGEYANSGDTWSAAEILPWSAEGSGGRAYGKTACGAICEAALLALRGRPPS